MNERIKNYKTKILLEKIRCISNSNGWHGVVKVNPMSGDSKIFSTQDQLIYRNTCGVQNTNFKVTPSAIKLKSILLIGLSPNFTHVKMQCDLLFWISSRYLNYSFRERGIGNTVEAKNKPLLKSLLLLQF